MATPRPLRWLHLSDLHLGCRGEALWHLVQQELEPSVREMAGRLGSPDLILLSGDLTNKGAKKEFDLVEKFLDRLLGWLGKEGGAEPLLLAVPGNHDLVRPSGLNAAKYRMLDRYHLGADDEDVRLLAKQLWGKKKTSFVKPLFAPYEAWWMRRILPALEVRKVDLRRSHFPGDFSVRLEIPGTFPLLVVGLNSTWQQYRGGDFERKLAIPLEQFHAALGDGVAGSPRDGLKAGRRALLVQHHPPGWLSKRGRATFLESIYRPEDFDLCLHGHQHEARTESVAISGGKVRCYFQAASLFGLEHYGEEKEDRQIGYAWGQLSAAGEIRLWPLERVRRSGGEGAFVHDVKFEGDIQAGSLLRSASGAELRARPETLSIADFRDYLEALVEETDHLDIRGISRADETGAARRYPIERLYTPLRTRGGLREGELGGTVALENFLPASPRLLIEGQPGAGKTTFLRFVACSLARDLLEVECPAGRSWRAHHPRS
jgi:3',5'-cyclic AMP phosphodiesterase CpdA